MGNENKEEFSEKYLLKKIKNSAPIALDIYKTRIKEIRKSLNNKQYSDKYERLKKHLEYYKIELIILESLNEIFISINKDSTKYPKINKHEFYTRYLHYTQMICMEDIGIIFGEKHNNIAVFWGQMENNKIELLRMVRKDVNKIK